MWESHPDLNREVLAMRLVWEYTTIPIPRPYRAVEFHGSTLIIMDFVEGRRLDRAWSTLSLWSRLRVAWTLRSYVRQLRQIPIQSPPFPGPLGPDPGQCHGPAFRFTPPNLHERAWGSTEELLRAVKESAEDRFRENHAQEPKMHIECEDTGPLVFTHHDLNMRNIILGKDGKVWLIDWDFSGYYPRYFEYLSMYASAKSANQRSEPSLWLYQPFITDPYFNIHAWLCGFPKPYLKL